MGVFIATKIGIPIIPGIVEISAIGGGFFLRPDVADLNSVINAVNLGTGGLSQNAQDLIAARRGAAFERIANGGEFAVMVYAGVGMLGTSGKYALDGRVLITLSDQAVLLDAAVGIYGFDANKLGAILNVNALFSPAFVSGAVVASMKVPTKSIMDIEATLDFYAGRSGDGPDAAWGIRGAIDGSLVTILDIEGDLFIGPPGFYMGLEARIDVDLYLIEIGASVLVEAWRAKGGSFGAYVEGSAYIKTKIGGANGMVKGAYVSRGNGSGFVYGSGYAELKWLPDPSGWFSISGSGIDGGVGTNDKYEGMVADARDEGRALADKAAEAGTELDNMKDKLSDAADEQSRADAARAAAEAEQAEMAAIRAGNVQVPDGALGISGYNFFLESAAQRRQNLALIVDRESMISPNGTLSADQRWVHDNVLTNTTPLLRSASSNQSLRTMRLQANVFAAIATVQGGAASARLKGATTGLENVLLDTESALEGMRDFTSPITASNMGGVPTVGPDGLISGNPTFSVDQSQVDAQQSTVGSAEAEIAALDARYGEALEAALAELAGVDLILSGNPSFDVDAYVTRTGDGLGGAVLGWFDRLNNVNVNTAAGNFRTAVENMEKYDAYRASHYWDQMNWANAQRTALTARRSGLYTAIGRETARYSDNNFALHGLAAGASSFHVQAVLDPIDSGEAATARNRVMQALQTRPTTPGGKTAHNDVFQDNARQFWYDFPNQGLRVLSDSARARASQVRNQQVTVMRPLLAAYRAFTSDVDDIYALKSELGTIVYGMADEYRRWRSDAISADSVEGISDVLASLGSSLEPPKINQMGFYANRTGNLNRATVSYIVTPPQGGEVVEVSYALERTASSSGSDNIYSSNSFYSAGKRSENGSESNQLDVYSFRESLVDQTQSYEITLRARSSGGNVALRQGRFTANVRDGAGANVTSGSILTTDVTPPSVSFVTLHTTRTANGQEERYGRKSGGKVLLSEIGAVRISAWATDAESDVRTYEYGFGSTRGATDVQDYRPLVGTRAGFGASSINITNTATVRSLALPHGQDVFLTVRATNGQGLTASNTFGTPVRYDSTAPPPPSNLSMVYGIPLASMITGAVQSQGDDANADQFSANQPFTSADALTLNSRRNAPPVVQRASPATPAVYATPPMRTPSVSTDPSPVNRRILVDWRGALDPETGILRHEYVLSDQSDPQAAFADEQAVRTEAVGLATFTGQPLDFLTRSYFHVRAVNNAGATGEAVTLPLVLEDVSPPTAPTAVLYPRPTVLGLWITQEPADAQTGIVGYQIAYGTTPAANDLRAFPPDQEDGSPTIDYGTAPTTSGRIAFGIPKGDLPTTGPVYAAVRAINGHGLASAPTVSGPVLMGGRPDAPLVSVTGYNPNTQTLSVRLDRVQDATAGIVEVSYFIREQQPVAPILDRKRDGDRGEERAREQEQERNSQQFGPPPSDDDLVRRSGDVATYSTPSLTPFSRTLNIDVDPTSSNRRGYQFNPPPPLPAERPRRFEVRVTVRNGAGLERRTTVTYDYAPPLREKDQRPGREQSKEEQSKESKR